MDAAVWSFYGFRNSPFGPAAVRAPFFRTDASNALIRHVADEIRNGRSVIGLRGEHGIGKSALIHDMAAALKAQACVVVTMDRASQCPSALQAAIVDAQQQAKRRGQAGPAAVTRMVLLFDDAEFMQAGMFRTLSRLLQACNSELLRLHLVLMGGPGLWPGLNAPDLAELRKAAISETLIPYLQESEAADYLDRKLQFAGQPLARLMTKRATADLVARAHGLPARLDALAEQALAFSYTRGRRRITARRLREALADGPAPGWALSRTGEIGLAAMAVACLVGVGAMVAWQHRDMPQSYQAIAGRSAPATIAAPMAARTPTMERRADLPRHVGADPGAAPAAHSAAALPKPPPAAAARSGLALIAAKGDDLASLYAKVYRGVVPPPFGVVQAANRAPVTQGMLVLFPAPPAGWPAS